MNAAEHKFFAEKLLTEGHETMRKLRECHEAGDRHGADDYGKKAMGIWAQAQVHATLALAPDSVTNLTIRGAGR